jgi:hypothetical protein
MDNKKSRNNIQNVDLLAKYEKCGFIGTIVYRRIANI